MKRQYTIIICFVLAALLGGCRQKQPSGEEKPSGLPKASAVKHATEMQELPYVLVGEFEPDSGVWYKVLTDVTTYFVTVDHFTADSIHGTYYELEEGSNCAEPHEFGDIAVWQDMMRHATVYEYRQPDYRDMRNKRYQKRQYKVAKNEDIEYAVASGYWSSKQGTEDMSYFEIVGEGLKNSIVRSPLSLTMDIYVPQDDYTTLRPLLMLMHGGGFYVGDKSDDAVSLLCEHFAERGYVTASINYRLGFKPLKASVNRAGYRALQDAHAAMRYLMEYAADYRIDTTMMFVGGTSAGSITALNLAFMTDKDRPKDAIHKRHNLGAIASSGNDYHHEVRIKALANMWGAVNSLALLKNRRVDIISFHGDADQVVPYDSGYPFSDVSAKLGERVFDRMYGSVQIDKRAKELGMTSELHLFEGEGHSLHHHADGSFNQENFDFIETKMASFFYKEIAGTAPAIKESRYNPQLYYIDNEHVSDITWNIEGGFILGLSNKSIEIVWLSDAPEHSLRASGHYGDNGLGFEAVYTITQEELALLNAETETWNTH